jgi:hypothetical protein
VHLADSGTRVGPGVRAGTRVRVTRGTSVGVTAGRVGASVGGKVAAGGGALVAAAGSGVAVPAAPPHPASTSRTSARAKPTPCRIRSTPLEVAPESGLVMMPCFAPDDWRAVHSAPLRALIIPQPARKAL